MTDQRPDDEAANPAPERPAEPQRPSPQESIYGQSPAQPSQSQWPVPPQQQPWGQPSAPQPPANPYAYNPQQPAAVPPYQQPIPGQQPPQTPWTQQGQPGQSFPPPGAPYGGPYAVPYGAPYGEVPPKKKSLAWLWILLAVIVVVGLMIWGAVALLRGVLGESADVDALYGECAAGSATACEDLYQEAGIGSEEEWFGQSCGGRTDGSLSCTDADMSAPANSFGIDDPSDDSLGDGAFVPGEQITPLPIDDPDGCMFSNCEPGEVFGDNARLDTLYTACESGNLEACDDLYWLSQWDSEYEAMGWSCGAADGNPAAEPCSERDDEWLESEGFEFDLDWED